MKFVPRQPPPPPPRPTTRATTRFLRLQPAEDAPETKFEPRPLPEFSRPPGPPATPSQRVRLRLDPQVASQPLPAVAAEAAAPEPIATPPWMDEAQPEANAEPPLTAEMPVEEAVVHEEAAGEAVVEDAEPAEIEPLVAEEESPAFFELPPETNIVKKAWFPPPPKPSTVPLWTPAAALTTPLPAVDADHPSTPSRPTLNLTTRRRPAEAGEAAPVRPELRRAAPSLAHLTRPQQTLGAGFWLLLVLVLLIFGAVLSYFVFVPRLALHVNAAASSAPLPARPVSFVVAVRGNPVVELPVSGMVEPSRETAIYARTSGYVRDWLADLGDKVKAGQVLAELDTPEVDHQLVEARAAADQAKASLALAQNESDRWGAMVAAHAVSQQDADARIAARNEAQANYNAAQANVGRLVDLEMFKEIRAPYAGTITARNLEVGTLVGSGPGPAGSELFHLIQTDPVRVFVNVPEAQAVAIHAGVPAKLEVAAYPGRVFTGQVVRDAGALDPQSHLLRTEVHVANPDGALMPGTLADVHLLLLDHASTLLVPAGTLVTTVHGASVVRIVPSDGREVARFTAVTVGRDFGSQVEILSSLQDGDRLVLNPPADLQDGMVVDARPVDSASTDSAPALLPPHPSAPRA